MNLKFASTLEFCIENINYQKFPEYGYIFNYNPLSMSCQCVFYDQNCELESSDIVADAVYKLTKNNIKRNLGTFSCNKKYEIIARNDVKAVSFVENDVLICIYTIYDYEKKQSCKIWETFFTQSLLLNISTPWDISFGKMETKVSHFLTSLSKVDGTKTRITMPIFCHGLENTMCEGPFKDFYDSILLPIRNFANQLLIIDTSCFSECHKDQYKEEIQKLKLVKNPEFEIYMYGACKGSTAEVSVHQLEHTESSPSSTINRIFASPFLDLILGRISYRECLGDQKIDITNFVNSVAEVTKFSDLERIFVNLHNTEHQCYAYHMEMIRPQKTDDILLKSWFPKFNIKPIIPVIREFCEDSTVFKKYFIEFKDNACLMGTLFKFFEPILGENFNRKYYVVNLETFELTQIENEFIEMKSITFEDITYSIIAFTDEKVKKQFSDISGNIPNQAYMMIEIHISKK